MKGFSERNIRSMRLFYEEYVMPDDLIQSVAEYTMKVAESEGPLYSTTEVTDYIDKKMGWK